MKHSVECHFAAKLVNRSAAPGLDPPINLIDLELLNNFTSSTYTTLTSDPTSRNIWRTAVVRKATGCEFVMRTILAVSATHMAQFRPEQKHLYVSYAMEHHKAASRTAIGLMAELLPQHQEDLWIFSVLTIYFGKARVYRPTESIYNQGGTSAYLPVQRSGAQETLLRPY